MRVLLLADTHIGLDLPVRPRIERRRRGDDFLANYERALAPALDAAEGIDLVVHGGDLLDRSRPPAAVVEAALAPLARVAAAGVPVVLVPGNHERSCIPRTLATAVEGLHILHGPCTVSLRLAGLHVAVSGYPFERRVGERFPERLEATGWRDVEADLRLLCLHQAVEGARVGPVGYRFRCGVDVVGGAALPAGFAAVLSGHIHRAQTLTLDSGGGPLAAPVVYPGSVERTAFAERHEDKSFTVLDLVADGRPGGRLARLERRPLPARPMVVLDVTADWFASGAVRARGDARAPATGPPALAPSATADGLPRALADRLRGLDPDAVVGVRVPEHLAALALPHLGAGALRRLAPPTMNVEVSVRLGPAALDRRAADA